MDRLEAEIRSLDLQVFIRIDHAAGAAQAGGWNWVQRN